MVENHSILEGAEEELEQPGDQPAEPQREDVGEDLEAGHLLSQRPQLLSAYNHKVKKRGDCSSWYFSEDPS